MPRAKKPNKRKRTNKSERPKKPEETEELELKTWIDIHTTTDHPNALVAQRKCESSNNIYRLCAIITQEYVNAKKNQETKSKEEHNKCVDA